MNQSAIVNPAWISEENLIQISHTKLPILYLEQENIILSPLALFKDINSHPKIPIPKPTSSKELCELIYTYHHTELHNNTLAKLFLYQFLRSKTTSTNVKDEQEILKMLALPYSETFPLLSKKILALDTRFLKFAAQKKLGFKTLCFFAQVPKAILTFYSQRLNEWPLSAQQFEILIQTTQDLCNRKIIHIESLIDHPAYQNAFNSELSIKLQINSFINALKELLHPLQNQKNISLEKLRQDIEKENEIRLSWDPSLEEKQIDIKFSIQKPLDLKRIVNTLNYKKKKLTELLDKF